ncbi:hypothetical protein AMTR_s00055p00059610 [Amborella trichopoda]|uniref:Uncharacterized protein n=1 Tax=Amborella trichopoda TaxID=13333 RepID=U5D7L6_AMBTC|nr:hypothetical protein AMTR_s00055p00059610 [Amborella trichopoda]
MQDPKMPVEWVRHLETPFVEEDSPSKKYREDFDKGNPSHAQSEIDFEQHPHTLSATEHAALVIASVSIKNYYAQLAYPLN